MTRGHVGRPATSRMAVRISCPICPSIFRYGSIRTHLIAVHGIGGRRRSEIIATLLPVVWSPYQP